MTKIKLSLCLIFFAVGPLPLQASPQLPDYLIYEGDTLPIYSLILEAYFEKINASDEGDLFGLKFRAGASLNCWRGYQAIFKIDRDSLFLEHILYCGELFNGAIDTSTSKNKMKELFPKKYSNEKVHADWWSADIFLPQKYLLRWDGVFFKSFEKEIQLRIKKGEVKSKKAIDNYIDDPNRINRRFNDTISKILFDQIAKLDWEGKLNEYYCDEQYSITIGKNGNVKSINMPGYKKEEIKDFWDSNE